MRFSFVIACRSSLPPPPNAKKLKRRRKKASEEASLGRWFAWIAMGGLFARTRELACLVAGSHGWLVCAHKGACLLRNTNLRNGLICFAIVLEGKGKNISSATKEKGLFCQGLIKCIPSQNKTFTLEKMSSKPHQVIKSCVVAFIQCS